jgi:hypothetical protein
MEERPQPPAYSTVQDSQVATHDLKLTVQDASGEIKQEGGWWSK